MKAVIDDVTYSGVFFAQNDESAECKKVMTFTAIGTNNMTIWGVKKDAYKMSDEEMVYRAISELVNSNVIPEKTLSSIELPTENANGSKITWKSDNESVIANDGTVTLPQEAQEVTMTATVTYESATAEKAFKTFVPAAGIAPDYKYDFESVSGTEVSGSCINIKPATLAGNASAGTSPLAGNVLTVKNSSGGQGTNYLALPDSTFKDVNTAGFTVSMWLKPDKAALNGVAILEASSSSSFNKLPAVSLYAGAYADYQSNEASVKGSVSGLTPEPGEWSYITYIVDCTGVRVYINGIRRNYTDSNLTRGLAADVVSQIDNIRIGSNVTNVSFDDIEFYSIALDDATVASKYDTVKDSHPNIKLVSSRSTIYAGGDKANTSKLSINTSVGYTVSYSSSDSSIASVDQSGNVKAKKAGKAKITADITANGETFQLNKNITVKKASIKFSKKKASIKVNKTTTFKVTGSGVNTSKVKWTSSKPSVLAINSKGKATAKKAGTAKITAKCGKFKVSVKVKVKK